MRCHSFLQPMVSSVVRINFGKYIIFHRPAEATLFATWKACQHLKINLLIRTSKDYIGIHQSLRLWSSTLRGYWCVSSCVAVEANPGFANSAASLTCEDRCLMWFLVVLLMSGCSPGPSFIIFFLGRQPPLFSVLWHLLLPQDSVICKGFPWISVNVTCFHIMLAYILVA